MSQSAYPELGQKASNAKDAVLNSEYTFSHETMTPAGSSPTAPGASGAFNTVANHPVTQNITSGPAAQAVYDEKDKTANEFRNVLDSRKVPDQPAATGQPLTHYHSMFYNILSWQNPRVTTISYASIVTFIFFTRYVPVLKYVFKALYLILGITAAAEVTGKVVLDRGLASHMRPRQYYTVRRETLDAFADDFEQLLNFFVIELQRIVFAENVYATVAAFASALFGYLLIKLVPTWGLALIATSVVYFAPLIYIKNQRVIDEQLSHAGEIINAQTSQFRDLAAHHANHVAEITKSTASEYSAKAQELIGQHKSKISSPTTEIKTNAIKGEDFPAAPSTEPLPSSAAHTDTVVGTTPVPDYVATIPENDVPELARVEEVDGIKAEALAS